MRERIEALFHACAAGDLEAVQGILEAGDHDVNGKNRWHTDIDPRGWQRSPLFAAVTAGHLTLARWLLDQGADVDQPTKYGDTALNVMLQPPLPEYWLAAAELLVEHGADPGIGNDDGDTALANARKVPAVWEKVEPLLARRR